jgi:hypothetical protein
MEKEVRIEDFLITKKQKEFEYDFFKKSEGYEKWEDVIRVKTRFYDKWIKRGKRYLTYLSEYYNQNDKLVAKWWGTLILPTSKGNESHRF